MIRLIRRLFYRARDIGADEYEQLSILQQTNMSQVWLAQRRGDKLITVTKIARVDKSKYAKANQEAIANEARWLHKFQGNPRIVQIYRTGETTLQGRPRFIAAEYLDGGTVEDLLDQASFLGKINNLLLTLSAPFLIGAPRRNRNRAVAQRNQPNLLRIFGLSRQRLFKGAIPVEQALEIILYMAEGLSHMHSKGVVHRDIKPDNVMFRRRPRHGRTIAADNLVLIDLGIASEHDRVTGAAVARGWSEPKRLQARKMRKALAVKSGFDIYCLGMVLRYLLTREKPNEVDEYRVLPPVDYRQLRVRAKLKPEVKIDLSLALNVLIEDCLHPAVEQRPSADEVMHRGQQILNLLSGTRGILRGPLAGATQAPAYATTPGMTPLSTERESRSVATVHNGQQPSLSQNRAIGIPSTAADTKHANQRRGFPFVRLAGTLAILLIGLLLSWWILQYGPNALASFEPISGFISTTPPISGTSDSDEILGVQETGDAVGGTESLTGLVPAAANSNLLTGETSQVTDDKEHDEQNVTVVGTSAIGDAGTSQTVSLNKDEPSYTKEPQPSTSKQVGFEGDNSKSGGTENSPQTVAEKLASQEAEHPTVQADAEVMMGTSAEEDHASLNQGQGESEETKSLDNSPNSAEIKEIMVTAEVTRKPVVQPTAAATADAETATATLEPTAPPGPTATSAPTLEATLQPTIEPSPTRKPVPNEDEATVLAASENPETTNSVNSQPVQSEVQNSPQLGRIPGLQAVVSLQTNGCRDDALDTWDEQIELNWVLKPAGSNLPEGYAQEVVIWRSGSDPLDSNQAYTIHGRDEIQAQNGAYVLQRRPKTLIPAVIERNEEYRWGIMLVNSRTGERYQRLTTVDCRFRPAGRLFGDNQESGNGGSK